MALFDFLKRRKQAEKATETKKETKKPVKKAAEIKVEKKEVSTTDQPVRLKKDKKVGAFSYEAIKQPHISEKASHLSEKDRYIFEVSPNYNKNEVKKAVEGLYNVDVLSVNIVKIPAKKRRLGRTEGFRKGYKKAIVKIKEGQKIEIL